MEGEDRPRRGRRTVAVLAAVVALAAVPAGVALAGDSSGGSNDGSGASAVQDRQERGHDRGDCPEKDGGGERGQDSTQL